MNNKNSYKNKTQITKIKDIKMNIVAPKPVRPKRTIFKRNCSKIQSSEYTMIEINKTAPTKIQNQAKTKLRNQKANDTIKPNCKDSQTTQKMTRNSKEKTEAKKDARKAETKIGKTV